MTARAIADSLNCADGVEQQIFCFNGGKQTVIDELDGVKVTRVGSFIKVSSQSLSLSYYKRLKQVFKDFTPDVVIFHYPNPFAAHFLLKILKKRPECRLVLWWHLDITKQKILGKLFVKQNYRLLSRAEKVIATSPNYINGSPYLSRYDSKCIVIPSCINNEHNLTSENVVQRAREIKDGCKGKTVCFAVGRHVEYKGLIYLIKASALLGENYVIYIGGNGELTDYLKSQARGDNKIVFLGQLSDEELTAYMLACDIYCFPSVTKNEAFGLSLAEAMNFGKPAVTFTINGSGVNYVSLNGVTGIEVENRNVEQYAGAISTLANDEELRHRLGEAARQRAQNNFIYDKFKENVINLVSSLHE